MKQAVSVPKTQRAITFSNFSVVKQSINSFSHLHSEQISMRKESPANSEAGKRSVVSFAGDGLGEERDESNALGNMSMVSFNLAKESCEH